MIRIKNEKAFIVIMIMFFSLSAFSQFLINDVNFDLIPQKRVKAYIENQKDHKIEHFTDMHASSEMEDMSHFYTHKAKYLVHKDINEVWNAYKNANPIKAWDGRIISVGLMYSLNSDNVYYRNYSYNGIENGQIIFMTKT